MGDDRNSSSSSFGLLFKISLFILLVLIPTGVEFYLLLAVGFVPSQWIGTPILVSLSVFFVGAVLLFSSRNLRYYLYSLFAGFVIAGGTIALSGLVYLSTITSLFGINAAYLTIGTAAIVLFALFYMQASRRPTARSTSFPGLITPSSKSKASSPSQPIRSLIRRKPTIVAGVELVEIPRAYAFPEEGKEPLNMAPQFLSIVRHLTLTDINFSLRIERKLGSTRVLFLTWSDNDVKLNHQKTVLQDTLQSNLSGFRFKSIGYFEGIKLNENIVGAAVEINGVPLSIDDEMQLKCPLDSIALVLQELDNGVLQIFVERKRDKSAEMRSLESQYRRLVESSETTVTKDKVSFFHGERQESKRIVDPKAMRKAELIKRKMERFAGSELCETRVVTASWAQKIEHADVNARRLAGAVMGSVRPDTEQEDFQKRYRRNQKEIARLLRGQPVGSTTTLTPGEVTTYLILPKTDMGVDVTSRQRFSSGTKQPVKEDSVQKEDLFECEIPTSVRWKERSRKIFHGNPIGENSDPIKKSYILSDPAFYDGHFLVVGTTRQGKTTTTISMTAQLIAQGINSVVFVPAKGYNWRVLMEIFPDLRVYKAGDGLVSLLAYNFWNPPLNVILTKWVDMIVQILTLWLPNDKVISMHVEDWVYTIYGLCGWDIEEGTKGRPILFEDIVEGVIEFGKTLNYDEEVNRNFYGALVHRTKSLLRKPALVQMFNTKGGISIPELLAHPTIIEMENLSRKDRILLMGMLTAAISEYKQANPSKKVENVLILEEAHYLLGRTDLEGNTNSTSRQEAVLTLIEMLRVLGGTGLGMILIEQLPSSLVEEAMKIPVNLIIHRLKEDRETTETIGAHAGCTDTQIQHLRGMKRGEAVVYVETEGEPKNVKILPLQFFIYDRLREDSPTDDEVRAHMKPVFEKQPDLLRSEPLPEGLIDRLIKGDKIDDIDMSEDEFAFLFDSEKFPKYCMKRIRLASDNAIEELSNLFISLVSKNMDGKVTTIIRLAERAVQEYCENNHESVRQLLNYEILSQMNEDE